MALFNSNTPIAIPLMYNTRSGRVAVFASDRDLLGDTEIVVFWIFSNLLTEQFYGVH